MEALIKKRIEEAAKEEREQCREDNNEIWRDRPTYNDVEVSFIKGANFALQNQWISVDEALPEDKTKVFVIVKTPVGIVHRADYHINDYWYMSRYSPEEIVTHWMPIPQLKGGKE